MIDDFVVELKQDQVSDESKKEYCEEEFDVPDDKKQVLEKGVKFKCSSDYCFHISEPLCMRAKKFSTSFVIASSWWLKSSWTCKLPFVENLHGAELNGSALDIFDDE